MKNKNSQKAAATFIKLLKEGHIRKVILPNTALNYSDFQAKKDLVNYQKFLHSFAYDDIKNSEVRIYNGD